MTGYFPIEQTVFFGNAAADVVDDEVAFVAVIPVVRDDADVRHTFAVEVPGNDIAGLVIRAVRRGRNGFTSTRKEGLQIGNASMVDIRVGSFQSPFLRISREVRRHVFVNFLLQVNAGISKCSNNDVRARASVGRHVAAGIRQHAIVLSVMGRYLDLFVGALDNAPNRLSRDVVDRGPLKRLYRTARAERMLERRSAASAEAGNKYEQEISSSHIRERYRRNY